MVLTVSVIGPYVKNLIKVVGKIGEDLIKCEKLTHISIFLLNMVLLKMVNN
jgi:hypothetical protein